jgi:hypothetical protein
MTPTQKVLGLVGVPRPLHKAELATSAAVYSRGFPNFPLRRRGVRQQGLLTQYSEA